MKHANPPRLCGVRYIMYYYSTLLQVYPLIILLLLLLMVLHNIITLHSSVVYPPIQRKRSNLCEYSKLIAPSFPSLFFPWPALLFSLLYMVDIPMQNVYWIWRRRRTPLRTAQLQNICGGGWCSSSTASPSSLNTLRLLYKYSFLS